MTRRSALLVGASVTLVSLTLTIPAAASGPAMVSVVDEELGVTGARPLGWVEYPPRVYRRSSDVHDLAVFAQRRCAPGLTPDEALEAIPAYGARFEPARCCSTEWCVWNVYRAQSDVWGLGQVVIEAALTDLDGTLFVTVLQAPVHEYPALREAVQAPALATMRPIPGTGPAEPEEPEDAPNPPPEPLAAR